MKRQQQFIDASRWSSLAIVTRCLLVVALSFCLAPVFALHIDIVVGQSGGKLTTSFCNAGALGCDSLPVLAQIGLDPTVLPTNGATGRQIFVTDFSDLDGGLFAVDDPGFFAGVGRLPPNLLLRYQALGTLKFFDPVTSAWAATTPNGERIRLFGGLDAQILQDTSHCGGLLICIPRDVTNFVESSTVYTSAGIQGASSLIIDNTSSNGALHAHLDWFLELPSGQRAGAVGAYLLEIGLTAEGLTASDPLFVLFNRGLSNATFGQALEFLMAIPPPPPPPGDGSPVVNHTPGVLVIPLATQFELDSVAGGTVAPFNLLTMGISGAGTLQLGANTVVTDVASGSARFEGEITGTGGLIKRGEGEQQLAGVANYQGVTRIEAGTLVATPAALGAAVVNAATLALEVASDQVYAGTISGNGRVIKTGPGILTLTGLHSYSGGTRFSGPVRISRDENLGAPNSPLTLNTAQLAILDTLVMTRPLSAHGINELDTGAHDLTLQGPLAGDGTLVKLGSGNLLLQGLQPFAGILDIQQGGLALNGSLAGHLNIAAAATLTGTADLVGDLHLQPGSRYRVKVAATGPADSLRSVRGRVHIEQARLEIIAVPGDYPFQRLHTILSAAAGVSGEFASIESSLAFLSPSLSYEPNQVVLRLSRNDLSFAELAQSPNQLAAGVLMDTISRYSRGDLATVLAAFETVTRDEVPAVLDALVGTPLIGIPTAATTQTNATMRQVASRLNTVSTAGLPGSFSFNPEREILLAMAGNDDRSAAALYVAATDAAAHLPLNSDHGVWLRAMAGIGEYDITTQHAAEADHTGLVLGYDWRVSAALTLGLYGAYTDAELNHELPVSKTAFNGWQAGGYGRLRHGMLHLDGLFSYGRDNYETTRQLAVGTLLRHAFAEFAGDSYNAYMETGYTFDAGVRVQPFIALQWSQQAREPYQERGAEALNLLVDGQRADSLRALLGVRLRHTIGRISTGAILAELRGAWAHEFEPAAEFRAQLSGDQNATSFTLRRSNAPRDAGNLGAGIVANLTEHAHIFADFDSDFSASHRAFGISAGVRARW